MNIEYEIKVLDIDVSKVRTTLKSLGFRQASVIEFRRYVYLSAQNSKTWLRLRTDGKKTTLTLKKYVSDAIDGVEETEVIVNDFETTNQIFEGLGLHAQNYQENRRTLFIKKDSDLEVSVDEWPHIPPYLEIEAKSQTTVEALLKQMNLSSLPTTSAPTSEVYKRYGLAIDDYQILRF